MKKQFVPLFIILIALPALASDFFLTGPLSPLFHNESLRQPNVIYGTLATPEDQIRNYSAFLRTSEADLDLSGEIDLIDGKFPPGVDDCTGVLIHARVLLTAAHCLIHRARTVQSGELALHDQVYVRFGLSEDDENSYRVMATDIVWHPEYYAYYSKSENYRQSTSVAKDYRIPFGVRKGYQQERTRFTEATSLRIETEGNKWQDSRTHDLALVFLANDVPEPFHPVKLVPESTPIGLRDQYLLAGYGSEDLHEPTRHRGNPHLRYAYNYVEGYLTIDNKRLSLFGFPVTDEWGARGDSGGPALLEIGNEFYLLGIQSWNVNHGLGTQVQTLVAPHTQWIESEMVKRGLPLLEI